MTRTRLSSGWLRWWVVVVAIAAGYVVTARLGLMLALPPEKKATAVWPPSGIAFAALLLLGYRVWPGIWLGAFLANLWDYFNPANPFPLMAHLLVSAGIATGSTLQALAGSFLVRRWIGPGNPFDRASHAFTFAGVAMLVCLIAATCGVASLYFGGFAPGGAVGFIWWTWWLGDMTGVLTVGTLVLTWSNRPPFILEPRRLMEAALFLVLLLALESAIFGIVSPVFTLPPPLAYLTVPFVVWATFRFGLHGAATTLFLLSIVAVFGTAQGTGPFTQPTIQESLLLLQVFMGVIAVTALVMAAVLNERRAAEARIESSQQREKERADELEAIQEIFKLVHQIGKIGHWEWNSLTDENKWSPEIEGLYGLQPGTFRGTYDAWAKLLHPDDLRRQQEVVRRAFDTGQYFTEFRVIWPDGSVHWLEARGNVFKDDHEKPVRFTGVNMDITERKLAEERLRESEERFRLADRRKDEFLATLAHELRNPLAPIRNALELMRRTDGSADLLEQARSMMGRQVEQMVRLIDDLLDMSRISQGKVQVRKKRVELAAVVRSVVETVRPLIDAQSHELTITVPLEPICLDADPTRLAQVVSNLLNNAAKYTEKGGHIWLIAERQGNEAVIWVRDTGIGIAAEHLPLLFEMFSQVAPALERSQGGLGIGLSLVRGLLELHGGSVEARSDGIGKGSEFIVRLPVVEAPVQHGEQRADHGEKPRSGPKHRILVVDDNRDAADSLAMMLSVSGHETRTAYDGLEAVQTAAGFRPNVVLLDIGLPKMNGYEAARQIRKQVWGTDIALIALTGWGQEEDKRRALEAGFDHHLTKPVEAAALEKLLARMTPMQQG